MNDWDYHQHCMIAGSWAAAMYHTVWTVVSRKFNHTMATVAFTCVCRTVLSQFSHICRREVSWMEIIMNDGLRSVQGWCVSC